MVARDGSGRLRILEAASALAREAGPGNLSLDAVAARAGVSKGGLLYHFPSKAKLLEAVVELFLESFGASLAIRERELEGEPEPVLRSYLDLFVQEHRCHQPPPSGVLAALAENPDFLKPVRRFERGLLDRMKADSHDPALAMLIFLAIHGFRSMQLLNVEIVGEAEFEQVLKRINDLLGAEGETS